MHHSTNSRGEPLKRARDRSRYLNGPFAAERERYMAHLRSEEHTSELQSLRHLVCRLLLEKERLNALPEMLIGAHPWLCLYHHTKGVAVRPGGVRGNEQWRDDDKYSSLVCMCLVRWQDVVV